MKNQGLFSMKSSLRLGEIRCADEILPYGKVKYLLRKREGSLSEFRKGLFFCFLDLLIFFTGEDLLQKEAFPGGGRWHGKAVTDEVAMDLPRTPSPKTFGFIIEAQLLQNECRCRAGARSRRHKTRLALHLPVSCRYHAPL
ncbi:MAG: hypothetical protein IJC84_00505 [Clostridia bacterium]|nr:hypothetical protein [Clostridia bacterium]